MTVKAFLGVPVYTIDGAFSVHEALVVVGDRVGFVGSAADAAAAYPNAEKVELQGGCIVPGFIDAHVHLQDFSLLFNELDLYTENQSDGILESIAAVSTDRDRDAWVVGGGADPALFNEFSRDDIDEACPDNPLVVYSRGMHSMLVNSATLRICHIDASSQNPLRGTIERDSSGNPTGILRGRACELVVRHIPEQNTSSIRNAVARGIDKLVSMGVTTFCDCSLHKADANMRTLMKFFHKNKLKTRAVQMYSDRAAVRLGALGIQSLFGNEMIMFGGCEIILDGTLSTKTAYMSNPYAGVSNNGMLLMEEQELHQILRRSYGDYIWAGVHANGDRAAEIALRVFDRLEHEVGIPKLLKRLEHAQSLKDEEIDAISRFGVVPVMCPGHIPLDRELALSYLGTHARLQHRLGSLINSGATLAFGSNAPTGSINPIHGIYAAVERRDVNEGPELRFYPRERIQLRDALIAYTRGSAASMGLDTCLGSLELGKYADLVVLSHDILGGDVGDLDHVSVLMTVVGGDTVYEGKKN